MSTVNLNYGKLKDSYLFAKIAERVNAYSQMYPEKKILRLGIGDVTQPLCPSVIEALHEAVEDQSRAESFHGYMPECGYGPLRSAIAEYYRRRNVELNSHEVFISSGASDELGDLLHLFDRNLDAVLLEPAYPAYADANIMEGRTIHFIETSEINGFTPEPPAEALTALIYICSPNNPTGAVFSKERLKQWVDYANRTGSVILFDAAYEAFITEDDIPGSIFEIDGARTCAIEISSLSKTAGFTGTRCGYTVIPRELVRDGSSLNKMWIRNRTTRTNGVSYILQ
ncbi:MAG: LL-diaminopimelate aminotransferase [Solobacterium sp.]|nr:LL-diaminopimelate aminotransferase [Solobacterium sp.]